jgi:hypothetical protein
MGMKYNPTSEDDSLIDTLLKTVPPDVTRGQRARLRQLLINNVDLFAKYEYDLDLDAFMRGSCYID